MLGFKEITVAAILAASSVAGPGLLQLADSHVGANDLANLGQVQQLSIATDGLYAPSLDSMTSGEFGVVLEPRKGSQLAYLVSEDRQHYVGATMLANGQVLVASDEASPVTCTSYTPECVAGVTKDASLIADTPVWLNF